MAVTGLSPGHQYEFRVYAENVYGRSDSSETTGLITTKSSGKKQIKKKQYEGEKFTFDSIDQGRENHKFLSDSK